MPIELDAKRFEFVRLGDETVMPVSVPNRVGSPAFCLPGSKAAPLPHLAYTAASYFARVVQRIESRAGLTGCLQSCYKSDLAEVLKAIAPSRHGMAWLPESYIASELAEGKLVRAGAPSGACGWRSACFAPSTVASHCWMSCGPDCGEQLKGDRRAIFDQGHRVIADAAHGTKK